MVKLPYGINKYSELTGTAIRRSQLEQAVQYVPVFY
jgi:hypothetical protein